MSLITGVKGLARGKGSDLADGSDVKGACTWGAIDTPRFNGVIKAGTKSEVAGKIEYLDSLPHLYFVLWDYDPASKTERCRVWVVRPKEDTVFRAICDKWYQQIVSKEIVSTNFQLHPPRGKNSNTFRNLCGNLDYPLLLSAVWSGDNYVLQHYYPATLQTGTCTIAAE